MRAQMNETFLTVECPECFRSLKVPAKHIGKRAKCPGCGTVVTIETPTPEPPPVPKPQPTRIAPSQESLPQVQSSTGSVFAALTKRRGKVVSLPVVIGCTLAALMVGYFAGREHIKYEFLSTLTNAFAGVFQPDGVNPFSAVPASTPATDWKKKHNLEKEDVERLYQQWELRTGHNSGGETAFWEMAIKSTPAEIAKNFPPLQPKEWYAASINKDSFSRWRNFDSDLDFRSGKRTGEEKGSGSQKG